MNRLNFRTLNFGHKAEHVIKTEKKKKRLRITNFLSLCI